MVQATAVAQETLTHKGYTAIVGWSEEKGHYVGYTTGLTDVLIEVYGATLEEAQAEFADSVEWYLDGCAKDGIEPEKPQRQCHPAPRSHIHASAPA
jgi:predicted HicB family RNase H-like nuclease